MTAIGLEAHPEQRAVLPLLAVYLREHYGLACHLYVGTKEDLRFYEKRGEDAFASITIKPALHAIDPGCPHPADERADLADERATLSVAAEIENVTGTPLNHVIMTSRHIGRGYALLGTNHPRSREADRMDYAGGIRRVVHAVQFWREHIEKHSISLIVGNSKIAAVGAAYGSVPFRQLSVARYGNYFYWADNEFGESRTISETFAGLKASGESSSHSLSAPYRAYTDVVKEYEEAVRLPVALRSMLRRVAQQVYWRLKGYAKAGNYYLHHDLGYMYRFHKDGQFLMGSETSKLSDLEGTPFVFFPLATEPELSLSQFSPEFFFQHAVIAAVSRDLPAGVKLAVKDTLFALGRRPDGFYRDILDLKNVVLLNVTEPGIEVVRKAAAVVTINGTAGFEAACMGLPVIAFGRHNLYNILDHVHTVEQLHDLRAPLSRVLSETFDEETAKRDGALLLRAISESCVDGRNFDLTKRDEVPAEFIEDLASALLESAPKFTPERIN